MVEPHPVKKGKKYLIEVEIVKDIDDFHRSTIMKSIYGADREQGINGEFKVNVLYLRNRDEMLEDLKNEIIEKIDQLKNR